MSQLNVDAIRASNGTGDAISLTASDKTCTANITNNLSNRNLIINGGMTVAQRGTSAATTTGIFVVDRFKSAIVGADEASTTAQVALTSSDTGPWAKGFRNALQITNGNQTSGAGAGDTQQITYGVEAQDIANSGWDYTSASSYITLSFWVKSSVAQNFYGYLRSEDGTKQLYAIETGSLSANVWTKVTKTVPGNSNIQIDNDTGQGFLICLYAFEGADKTDSGQGLNSWGAYSSTSRTPDNTSTWWTTNDSTFAITGVQLEVGDYATDFEHRTYADELDRCQRYYYRIDAATNDYFGIGNIDGSNTAQILVNFGRDMRADPSSLDTTGTASHYILRVASNATCTSVPTLSSHITTKNAMLYFTASSHGFNTGQGAFGRSNDNSSFLGFSAEL